MSLVSTIADAVGISSNPKVPASTAEIETKIANARVRIVQLQSDHARECLRWADTGNATERDRLADQLAAARVDLASLQSALSMAKARNSQLERERLAGLNASRLHSATIHLRAAEKAAAELSVALEKAAKARRTLLATSAKAHVSSPSPLPKASLTEANLIDALIANEMHRVSFEPSTAKAKGTGALPGSRAPSLVTKDQPEAITPLVDQLRQAHDFAISVVKGEISVERTPLIEAQLASDAAKLEAVADAVSEPNEPADFNAADLLPGTRSAAEIAASVPRVKLSVGNSK